MLTTRPSTISTVALGAALFLAVAEPARAQVHDHAGMHAAAVTDSAAVASAVHAFHGALQAGDTAAVLHLLGSDVLVAESGGLENRDEYLSHHLPGDMAFAAAVSRELGPMAVTVSGDVAWAMSTSRTSGTFRDRAVNSVGAELMVLSRDGDAWRIRAIHWSSRQAR
ncbi:MAG: nuclear transport factor 2 family protein [Longimicrobiales bacterium]|nr:nuclear transport factor 2 family protein [Longimicrobiales bacterium]